MATPKIEIPTDTLAEICRKWKIKELALFGSVLRDDFGPESDMDVLVEFDADAPWSSFDVTRLWRELQELFGRPISFVERPALLKHHNSWLRHEILSTAHRVYAA
jgi:predicted nucleotidyltransferase